MAMFMGYSPDLRESFGRNSILAVICSIDNKIQFSRSYCEYSIRKRCDYILIIIIIINVFIAH